MLRIMGLQLIFRVHRATHRIGLYIQRHAPDLNQAEAHILCQLHESGACAVAELHRAFAHKRSTLTSVLDRLETRGLITREPSREDRRSFVIGLTPAGRKKAATIHRLLETLESGALRDSHPRAVATFGEVIGKLEERAAPHAGGPETEPKRVTSSRGRPSSNKHPVSG